MRHSLYMAGTSTVKVPRSAAICRRNAPALNPCEITVQPPARSIGMTTAPSPLMCDGGMASNARVVTQAELEMHRRMHELQVREHCALGLPRSARGVHDHRDVFFVDARRREVDRLQQLLERLRACKRGADSNAVIQTGGTLRGREQVRERCRSEERRVGKECRSRWSPDH